MVVIIKKQSMLCLTETSRFTDAAGKPNITCQYNFNFFLPLLCLRFRRRNHPTLSRQSRTHMLHFPNTFVNDLFLAIRREDRC
jgi:hypothetical protein